MQKSKPTLKKEPATRKKPVATVRAPKKPAVKEQPETAQKPAVTTRTRAPKKPSADDDRTRIPEKRPDGTRLIRAINARAALLGLNPQEVAQAIDMSYSYFITLANEPHRFAGINRRWMRNIARFLGINTIMAYQYAGFLEEEDLNVEVTLDRLLSKAREDIERDPLYGVYVPAPDVWETLPLTQRLLVLAMYNEIQDLRVKEAAHQLGNHKEDRNDAQK